MNRACGAFAWTASIKLRVPSRFDRQIAASSSVRNSAARHDGVDAFDGLRERCGVSEVAPYLGRAGRQVDSSADEGARIKASFDEPRQDPCADEPRRASKKKRGHS